MRFSNWSLDDVINYLQQMKAAPSDRLDYTKAVVVSGDIYVENVEDEKGNVMDAFLLQV